MNIVFDLQGIQNNSRDRGIGRYVLDLFKAISSRTDVKIYALLNSSMTDTLDTAYKIVQEIIGEERIFLFPALSETMPHNDRQMARRKLCEAAYEAFVSEIGCDVLLVGSLFEGFNDKTITSLAHDEDSYKTAVILYDLIPLSDTAKYLGGDLAHRWYFDRLDHLKMADLLCGISESSRQEGLKYLNFSTEDCINAGTAINPEMFYPGPAATPAALQRLGVTKPFIMHASALDERKNFEGLVDAFALVDPNIRDNFQLVLVGGGNAEAVARIRNRAKMHGLDEKSVILAGYVSDPDLAILYRSCHLFVFPSFHEGFGLPVLEAMSCGCPAIGSNVTSIPEVVGREDLLFDPASPGSIATAIERILSSDKVREAAVAHANSHSKTFSWAVVADRIVSALKTKEFKRKDRPYRYPSVERMIASVSKRYDFGSFDMPTLRDFSQTILDCQNSLIRSHERSIVKSGKIWRVEGPFDSSYSLALVNRETARALNALGYDVALHSTEGPGDFEPSMAFLKEHVDIKRMNDLSRRSGSKDAFVVSRNLYPPRVADMNGELNALHHYAWEESGFPHEWADDFNSSLQFMTTLSRHVEKIMIDNGVSVPMAISGNGVDHWERILPDPSYRVEARDFKFLHVSSCFPRKGIDALLAAYESAFDGDDSVTLIIKTFDNPHNDVQERLESAKAANPRFPHVVTIFADLSDSQLKALYQQCDVMVGPSCAEGLGLPFAEAMLSGIPVITTAWGGQLDICNPSNSWLVDYQFERASTHFGLWSSAWAKADTASLAGAMQAAHRASSAERAAMAARGRQQLMAEHKWSDVVERLSAAAAVLPAMNNELEPRIGWISTWNDRCGIATYSEHLTRSMPAEVTIFAPQNVEPMQGDDTSIRIWERSKHGSNLVSILKDPTGAKIDIFVIQFNNTFFDHVDLKAFIEKAQNAGKKVIMCLHSTVDQAETTPVEEFHLSHMVSTLGMCDRLLVHSIADLNRLKALGLVDNVALFPHGVLSQAAPEPRPADASQFTVATYGFALPHKGLPQMLEAIRILNQRGQSVRWKMVNALYPAEVSKNLVSQIRRKVAQLGIGHLVDMHNEFLSDDESMTLVAQADLIVFPYQNTAESASGAVRYGMASQKPVAVTPLPIFDDLKTATFVFNGVSPEELANGIQQFRSHIETRDSEIELIAEQATAWRKQHDYSTVGRRLANMCKALVLR